PAASDGRAARWPPWAAPATSKPVAMHPPASTLDRQSCARLESMSSTRHRLLAKADHLSWIQQTPRIVSLFRPQLNVVRAKPPPVLQVVHMRVGHKDAD